MKKDNINLDLFFDLFCGFIIGGGWYFFEKFDIFIAKAVLVGTIWFGLITLADRINKNK